MKNRPQSSSARILLLAYSFYIYIENFSPFPHLIRWSSHLDPLVTNHSKVPVISHIYNTSRFLHCLNFKSQWGSEKHLLSLLNTITKAYPRRLLGKGRGNITSLFYSEGVFCYFYFRWDMSYFTWFKEDWLWNYVTHLQKQDSVTVLAMGKDYIT